MRAWDAADGLHELALHGSGALDLETQSDEERSRRVEVPDGDADVVETLYVCHGFYPPSPGSVAVTLPVQLLG